jgi:transposase
METTELKEFYGQLLKIEAPWKLSKMKFDDKIGLVDIYIDYDKGSEFSCSVCNKSCKVHDSSIHRIRHLNCFQYRSYLNVKVPRTKCSEHGVKVIESLPWGHTNKHFSFFLNS